MIPRSTVPGVTFPGLPDAPGAVQLALAWQLDQSQWWSADELAAHTDAQRRAVWTHARETCAHYADVDADDWARVPILTRDALVAAGARASSSRYPQVHGPVKDVKVSRTAGDVVAVKSTGVTRALWSAITLRDHAWHRRDLRAKLASIRYTGDSAPPPDGVRAAGWGPATAAFAPDAPLAALSVKSSTDEQLAWLVREDPAYLLIYPTVLDALARRIADTGARLPSLRQVRTISEALTPETRALVAEVLRVPVVDTYSAEEVGYIALECPSGAGYHVQAERLLVEILRDDGTPCAPGETGRVVVTDLHNFATPLLRYELGDHAEVAGPCPCGRGLPALARIWGRSRGMLRYPDGRTVFPIFAVACREAARFRELQLVQTAPDALTIRVEADRPLTAADHAALTTALHRAFGFPFRIALEQVDRIERSARGKREEFVSYVQGAR